MYKSNYNRQKRGLKYKKFYSRQLNKLILVLSILIIIIIIKTANNSTSNNIIKIIKENIYYDFNWKEDGIRLGKYMKKVMGNTIESIEIFNMR